MLYRLIRRLNQVLLGVAACLFLLVVFSWFFSSKELQEPEVRVVQCKLPSCAFVQPDVAYDQLGGALFSLKEGPYLLELPDLRRYLTYQGRNERPDADPESVQMHFALQGDKNRGSIAQGEPLYLKFDRTATPSRYLFSPDNKPAPLWIEAYPAEGEVQLQVRLRSDEGTVIAEPAELASFTLPAKRMTISNFRGWNIGEWRVDGTFLARQKARWWGEDQLLSLLGGDEFIDMEGKQRIDFGEAEESYSHYLEEGECLIWEQNRWQKKPLGLETRDAPLLCLRKVSDRLLNLILWDVDGQRQVPLNLIKSTDIWSPQLIQQQLRFVGAKTRRQTLVEVGGKRMVLRPNDWLLQTEEGWKKLSTIEEIDDYLERRLRGVLFVFEGVERQGDSQVLKGLLFSSNRSAYEVLEIPAGSSPMGVPITPSSSPSQPVEEHSLRETVPLRSIPMEKD